MTMHWWTHLHFANKQNQTKMQKRIPPNSTSTCALSISDITYIPAISTTALTFPCCPSKARNN